MTTSVYKLYKLAREEGNVFTKEHKRLERDLHVVTDDFANQTNDNYKISGLFYELDKEATKLYQEGKDFRKKTKSSKEESKSSKDETKSNETETK